MSLQVARAHEKWCGVLFLDDAVRDGKQRRGHFETEHSRGLEVKHQVESGLLDDRKVGGLLTFQNPTDVEANLAPRGGEARSVARKRARIYRGAVPKHSGYCVASAEQYDLR